MADALDAIPDRARVHIGYLCAVPLALLDAMAEHRDRWTAVEIVTGTQVGRPGVFGVADGPFRFAVLQAGSGMGELLDAGVAEVVPAALSQFPALCAPGGPLAVDVALVQVSPPGPDGRFSMGVGGADQVEIVRRAPRVIAEVNPRMPYTFGATELARDEIDILVDVEHELPEVPPGDFGPTEEAIAGHAAAEIPDGATIQFGIGRIPDAIVSRLSGHRDLGVHSGMIGDACIDLVEAGALTGATKSIDAGRIVGGVVVGTRRGFDWVHRNPDVVLVPACYSHDASTLGRIEGLVAINSVLEVAVDGSMNAENIGPRVLSGPGGQPDYALGASIAPGGIGITAITSTASKGTTSRIVRALDPAVPVTTPRWLADRVITEYGVARLRGASLPGRAAQLRAIAHPDHRARLA